MVDEAMWSFDDRLDFITLVYESRIGIHIKVGIPQQGSLPPHQSKHLNTLQSRHHATLYQHSLFPLSKFSHS